MPSVTIDAGVLAVPAEGNAREDAFQYVERILDWSKLLGEPWIAIYMSERASEALFEDGLYPLRDQLRELFVRHGIVEYDVNTVAKVVERLLAITPSFETYFRLRDILTENLETLPDIIRLVTYSGLQSDLARCVVLIAILRAHCTLPLGGHALVIPKTPDQVISVKAQIHDVEHGRDDLPAFAPPPEYFEGEVLVCDNFKGLVECLDEATILTGATDGTGISLAIRIALFKHLMANGEEPDWSYEFLPTIGRRFRETCQSCCRDQAAALPVRILRSIIETITKHNLADVHAMRLGSGGNAPQRLRGRDKAQRRDIDREFHLHYWDCEDGTIELASVVYHNDFSIPE
ncbi:MAG: hypothetical protein KDD02_25335 [Phaeodactylibacter sp.]|nr:hypothetical protein [Phaeodactylibacter sp.]